MSGNFGFGFLRTADAHSDFSGGLIRKHWYLDLICKRDYTNNVFLGGAFSEGGKGVSIYILSTGVNTSSKALQSRVFQIYGAEDENGHGSALASIAAGIQYGIARSAKVFGVTLDYENLRSSLDDAITFILSHINSNPDKALVLLDVLEYPNINNNYRLTSDADSALSVSVQRLLDLDIPTIACVKDGCYEDDSGWVGSINVDYCPPINTTDVLAFAGFDENFNHFLFSNYGSSVFLYSPCSLIIIEDLQNVYRYSSHADYASAICAGIAALYLSKNKDWGHNQVKEFFKKICRVNKIDNSASYGNDAIYSVGKNYTFNFQDKPMIYGYPNFAELTTDVVNAYFVKNSLESSVPSDLGTYLCNQTLSILINVTSITAYGENKPFIIKIIESDCSFLKLDKSKRLYGFIPTHVESKNYTIKISINNGINSLVKILSLRVLSESDVTKTAFIQTVVKEKNWLDINLTADIKTKSFDLHNTQSFLKNDIVRPVSRDVSFYDHNSGRYSNNIKSSPDNGAAIVPTNSDVLYAVVVEDTANSTIANSKVIDRIESI